MAITDKRGRRKANTDTRVTEAAKAEMPAYGFDGLTVGEISSLKRERDRTKDHRAWAEGKTRKGTDDKKR